MIKKLDAAGVKANVSRLAGGGMKIIGPDGSKVKITTKKQMQLLPSGTPFIGPDGEPYEAP